MEQSNQPAAPITLSRDQKPHIGQTDSDQRIAFRLELLEARIAPLVKVLDKMSPL
jgi:hypothetical protein